MPIVIEQSPNPRSLLFYPGIAVAAMPLQVNPATADQTAPLAGVFYKVFKSQIDSIFMGKTFIMIRLHRAEDWQLKQPNGNVLRDTLAQAIERFAASGQPFAAAPAVLAAAQPLTDNAPCDEDDDVVSDIKDILDRYVNGANSKITKDGGKAIYQDYNHASKDLFLHMIGSCGGCPGSVATLEYNVMALFKHYKIPVSRIINLDPLAPANTATKPVSAAYARNG